MSTRRLVGIIAAAVIATMFVLPADARAKKPKRPAAVQTQKASPSLDGRTLGRMRTCGFDYLQYDGMGTPYGPYCHFFWLRRVALAADQRAGEGAPVREERGGGRRSQATPPLMRLLFGYCVVTPVNVGNVMPAAGGFFITASATARSHAAKSSGLTSRSEDMKTACRTQTLISASAIHSPCPLKFSLMNSVTSTVTVSIALRNSGFISHLATT